MTESKLKLKSLALATAFLISMQLMHIGMKSLIFVFLERTKFSDSMASLASMTVLFLAVIAISRMSGISMSVFPKKFGVLYIIASILGASLLISTPFFTHDTSANSVILLFYGAVVTPIYEESIFRGFLWNLLKRSFKKDIYCYILTTVLFALWHYGYVYTIAFRVSEGLFNVMFWKSVVGFGFGTVLGALRLKTKNCYSTMLLHGILNTFGK